MDTLKRTWLQWLVVAMVLAGAAYYAGIIPKAHAADKGAPPAAAAQSDLDTWTGFGAGLRFGLAQGVADFGAPINFDINGQTAGAVVFYRHQFGAIVLGIDGGYDRVWGDLRTFGVNNVYTVGGSVGVLPTKNALLYGRVEWLRAQGGGGHIDGWGLGAGTELKIANSPLSFSLEYIHDFLDKNAFGPGVDVTADRIMFTGKYQFGVPRNVFADR